MSNKPSYTYPIRHIFARVLLVELAFWLAFVGIIALFGYFSEDDTQTHLVFVKGDMFWGLSLLLPLYMFFYYDLRRKNALTQHLTHRVRASIFKPIQPQQTLINFLLFRSFLVFILLAMTQPSF
jgi:hypothetical protein